MGVRTNFNPRFRTSTSDWESWASENHCFKGGVIVLFRRSGGQRFMERDNSGVGCCDSIIGGEKGRFAFFQEVCIFCDS